MPECVVDFLEPIEVEHHHGGLLAAPAPFLPALRDAVVEQGAVRQPGQRVVHGEEPALVDLATKPPRRRRDRGQQHAEEQDEAGADGEGQPPPPTGDLGLDGGEVEVDLRDADWTSLAHLGEGHVGRNDFGPVRPGDVAGVTGAGNHLDPGSSPKRTFECGVDGESPADHRGLVRVDDHAARVPNGEGRETSGGCRPFDETVETGDGLGAQAVGEAVPGDPVGYRGVGDDLGGPCRLCERPRAHLGSEDPGQGNTEPRQRGDRENAEPAQDTRAT